MTPAVLLSAFEDAPIGMAVLRVDGTVLAANRALGGLLLQPPGGLVGQTLFEVTHPDDLAGARASCARISSGLAGLVRMECRLLRSDGSCVWVLISTARPPAEDGEPPRLIMHVQDVDRRRAREAELTHQALHDPLTGLPNRTVLLDRMTHALALGRRLPTPACLFMLDLNGFKRVNDTMGHGAGDEVLRELARRLGRLLRPSDTAARLGGDEFAVLCEDTRAEEVDGITARLRAAAAAPFVLGEHTVLLTTAVGCASFDTGMDDDGGGLVADLLHQADLRMYQDKRDQAPGDRS
jgi:diguanylate cyclase (GGDEF)-like protein/PAS domain S-box-containing protein